MKIDSRVILCVNFHYSYLNSTGGQDTYTSNELPNKTVHDTIKFSTKRILKIDVATEIWVYALLSSSIFSLL